MARTFIEHTKGDCDIIIVGRNSNPASAENIFSTLPIPTSTLTSGSGKLTPAREMLAALVSCQSGEEFFERCDNEVEVGIQVANYIMGIELCTLVAYCYIHSELLDSLRYVSKSLIP
jgi:hypothetical protein